MQFLNKQHQKVSYIGYAKLQVNDGYNREQYMLSVNFKKIGLLIILSFTFQTGWAEVAVPKEGEIARAVFTSSVQNHEPIDQLNHLSQLISEVFYFTEFKNFQGQTLTHEWLHHGKLSHRVSFAVGGKRWRVHSSKAFKLGKKQEGTWTVKVRNETGVVLRESQINYMRSSTLAEIAAAIKTHTPTPVKNSSTSLADRLSQIETNTSTVVKNSSVPSTEIRTQTIIKNPSTPPEENINIKDNATNSSSQPSTTTEKMQKDTSQESADPRPIWDKI